MFRFLLRLTYACAAVLALAACTTGALVSIDDLGAIPPTALSQVSARISTWPDPHEGTVVVAGPPVFDQARTPPVAYLVFSSIDPRQPGTKDRFRIGIVGLFPKRVYLKDVFADGRALPAKVHDRERIDCGRGCAIAETVIVTITEAELKEWAGSGLSFAVVGRRTRFTMSIPAAYFTAVLDRHVETRRSIVAAGGS